jgi:hypothetical protein
MGPKYEHFKFAIGEVVTMAAGVSRGKDDLFIRDRGSRRMQIIERLYQECPGGVQLSYKVRVHWGNGDFSTDFYIFNEIELAPISPEVSQ